MDFIDSLRKDCEYDPEEDSTIDALIAYKDALEDIVASIDEVARANTKGRASAADVCQVVFDQGLG